jgi:hypothetical protein
MLEIITNRALQIPRPLAQAEAAATKDNGGSSVNAQKHDELERESYRLCRIGVLQLRAFQNVHYISVEFLCSCQLLSVRFLSRL